MVVTRRLTRRRVVPGIGDYLRTVMKHHPVIRDARALVAASGLSMKTVTLALQADTISSAATEAIWNALGLGPRDGPGDGPDDVAAGARDAPVARPIFFPSKILLRENEIERSLIEAGASEHELEQFRRWVRESSVIRSYFGKPQPDNRKSRQAMQLYEQVAVGFRQVIEHMIAERARRSP